MHPTQNLLDAAEAAKTIEWEIVLSGSHPDIFVIISAPENATDDQLCSLAESEAMRNTYIFNKRALKPKGDS